MRAITLCFIFIALATSSLSADSVSLWSGESFNNVRLLYGGRLVIIIFADGKVKRVPADKISSTEFGSVNWDRPDLHRQIARLQENMFRMARIEEKRSSSLWRSAVFAGWGHGYSGHEGWGTVYMSVSTGLLVKFALDRDEQTSLQRKYNKVGEPIAFSLLGPSGLAFNVLRFESLKNRMNAKARSGNRALLVYGLLWFWNLFDLYTINDPDKAFQTTVVDSFHGDFTMNISSRPAPEGPDHGFQFMFQARF